MPEVLDIFNIFVVRWVVLWLGSFHPTINRIYPEIAPTQSVACPQRGGTLLSPPQHPDLRTWAPSHCQGLWVCALNASAWQPMNDVRSSCWRAQRPFLAASLLLIIFPVSVHPTFPPHRSKRALHNLTIELYLSRPIIQWESSKNLGRQIVISSPARWLPETFW